MPAGNYSTPATVQQICLVLYTVLLGLGRKKHSINFFPSAKHYSKMDLLDSIMKSMDKPPSLSQKEKKIQRAKKEFLQKQQEKEKESMSKFNTQVLDQISAFINDANAKKLTYEPMDKIHRTAIHEIVENAGLLSYSFGQEGESRYVMVFKKEFPPSEEELAAYRRGEEYDPSAKKDNTDIDDHQEEDKIKDSKPKRDYREKYMKIVGKESGIEAAKITVPNENFGFVPSSNKRDQRSIEETLNEIRSRKRSKKETDAKNEGEDSGEQKQ
ncbi:Sperm-associated antigen 7 [Trichoplax sp. H2]|nr:Sperm-associated antigen 7 [Trichoplax sp. H2]|eukprot:RDD44193.1 Sperm-associated antigen 7 [Trichoplax sp. H2]